MSDRVTAYQTLYRESRIIENVASARRFLFAILIVTFLMSSFFWAQPRLEKGEAVTKYINGPLLHPPNPEVYDETPFVQQSTRTYSLATRAGPTERVIVILIEFTDTTHSGSNTVSSYNSLIFSGADSMYEYYREASYGQTSVVGDVAPSWYQSAYPMSEYGADSAGGVDDLNGPIYRLVTEAVLLADSDIDFSDYDEDNDGTVDHVIIVHAGNGQETLPIGNPIWSHHWAVVDADTSSPGNQDLIVDGVQVYGYTMLAEDSPMGVFAHEFGHDLGLPDLYDTDDSSEGVGDWDIMAGGSWLGFPQGSRPSLPSAFSKIELGWVTPIVVDVPMVDQQIPSVWDNPIVYKLPIGDADGEYFLVENRQQLGFDTNIPGSGLLIWHIDESVPDNSRDSHRMVDLEEADERDGDHPLDATDPWFDNRDGFHPKSVPNSNAYGNIRTGWRVKNIGPSGDPMTADLSKQVLDDVVVVSVDVDNFIEPSTTIDIMVNISNRGAREQTELPVNLSIFQQEYGIENLVRWEEKVISSLELEESTTLSFSMVAPGYGLYIVEARAILDDDEIPEDNDKFAHFNSNDLFFWDDVESGNNSWNTNTSLYRYRWDILDEYPLGSYSPTHSWHFGLYEGTPSAVNRTEFVLESDIITVSNQQSAFIVLHHRYIFERIVELGGLKPTDQKSDTGILEITTNGVNWSEIKSWGRFPGDGVQFDWKMESFDISSHLQPGTNSVQLRFTVKSAGRPVGEGWWLDNIGIVEYEPQYGIVFKVYDQEKTVEPGSIASFLFKIVNVGDYEDEFRIDAMDLPTDWDYAISENASKVGFTRLDLELGVDESSLVYLKVETPTSAERGNKYNATAVARSLTDDDIREEVNVTVAIATTLFDLTLGDLCFILILLLILVLPIAIVVDYLRKTRKGF